MNTNIESALTALIGNDPRFQRAMAMLNGKTAQTADLIQKLRPAPVPAFIVPNPLASTGTTTPTT